jgi:hypothetical protein
VLLGYYDLGEIAGLLLLALSGQYLMAREWMCSTALVLIDTDVYRLQVAAVGSQPTFPSSRLPDHVYAIAFSFLNTSTGALANSICDRFANRQRDGIFVTSRPRSRVAKDSGSPSSTSAGYTKRALESSTGCARSLMMVLQTALVTADCLSASRRNFQM